MKKSPKAKLISRKHSPMPHRLARSQKDSTKNFNLLFALQKLAYPELDKGIRMDKTRIKKLVLGEK